MMRAARIKPVYTKSQYSKQPNMLDYYLLVVEGGERRRFPTREVAVQYAADRGYRLLGARFQ